MWHGKTTVFGFDGQEWHKPYITAHRPPVGLNLFLASYRFDQPITKLYRATLPFLGLLMITLAIITYFPFLSLWLVGLM